MGSQMEWAETAGTGAPKKGSFPSRQRALAAERRCSEGVRSHHVGLNPCSDIYGLWSLEQCT